MTTPWKLWYGWIALGLGLICFAGLFFLIEQTAEDYSLPWWVFLIFFIAVPAALTSSLALSDHCPWGQTGWRSWLRPRPLAAVFGGLFFVFSFATDVLSHLSPKQARESETGIIEKTAKQNSVKLDTIVEAVAPPTARLLGKISGLWGEPGCRVAYRFTVYKEAVVVEAERRPPGVGPYRLAASIAGINGGTLTVIGQSPEAARGMAAKFTYVSDGVTERLRWDDIAHPVPLDLDRCQ